MAWSCAAATCAAIGSAEAFDGGGGLVVADAGRPALALAVVVDGALGLSWSHGRAEADWLAMADTLGARS